MGAQWRCRKEEVGGDGSMLDSNWSKRERETTGARKGRGSDGKGRRERDRLVLVFGVDGRRKYNT
jgi:hypothetical protein